MSMYLRMNVGLYQGEIRGPFRLDAAKALIERGDASPTESIGDGKFRVIEQPPAEETALATPQILQTPKDALPVETPMQHKKARR
jgi:hypothetical protein